jgi:FXSXX-COOH protein
VTVTDERTVVSPLGDLGQLSMRDMTALPKATLRGALRRIIPDGAVKPVTVTAFNSAI